MPNNRPDREAPALFIEGWLSERFAAGEGPIYGYPASPLPETTGGDMEVVTGFMADSKTVKSA